MHKAKCNTCNVWKIKNRSEYREKYRNYVYRDETGAAWASARCPDCRRLDLRKRSAIRTAVRRMRGRPPKTDDSVGPGVPEFAPVSKPCPKCGFRTVNRYRCPTCWGIADQGAIYADEFEHSCGMGA